MQEALVKVSDYGSGQTPVVQDTGLEIRQHLGLLRARFWTILACLVVVFTIAAVRTFRATPIYQASARLLIERRVPELTPLEGLQERRDRRYGATEVKLITSRAVLEEALQDEKLAEMFKGSGGLEMPPVGLFASVLRGVRRMFTTGPVRTPEPWEMLSGVVQAQAIRDTNLVDVNVQGPSAEQNARIANAVAEAYVGYTVELRKESAGEAFELLQQQRKEQEQALTEAEDGLLEYRQLTTIPHLGSPDGDSAVTDRLKALNDQYTTVQMRRMELSVAAKAIAQAQNDGQDINALLAVREIREDQALSSLLQSLKEEQRQIQSRRIELDAAMEAIAEARDNGDGIASLLAIEMVRKDPAVMEIRERLTQAEMEIGAGLRAYGEKHPHVLALHGQREYLASRLREAAFAVSKTIEAEHKLLERREKAQKEHIRIQLPETARSAAKAIETEYALLMQRENEITQALAGQNLAALEQARKAHGYQRLKRDMERQARVFDVIVDRMKAVDLTKDAGVTNVSIVERATVPRFPIKPNKNRALMLGAFLGLLLGVGMAYGLEHLDDTVKTPDDVEGRLGVPCLGYVPEIAAGNTEQSALTARAMHSLCFSSSSTTESFRAIRTNIYFSGEKDEIKSLLISSAVPQEGKTLFAVNLAATIAREGKRVLLVDADLRRPGVHSALGLKEEPGLTDMLTQGTSLEELFQIPKPPATNKKLDKDQDEINMDCFHVLTAGGKTPNPAKLLGGEAMARFIRQVREQYDMVIFDTCPAMFVADAAALTGGVDGVIMITRTAKTRRGAAERARKQLEAVKGKILGAVLNGVRPRALGGYGYYYYDYERYYKDRQDDNRPGI